MEHDHSELGNASKKIKLLYKQSILHFLLCYVTMSVYRNVPGIVHVLFILTLFYTLSSSKDQSLSLYPPNIPFSRVLPYPFLALTVDPQHVLEAFLCSSKSIRISVVFPHLAVGWLYSKKLPPLEDSCPMWLRATLSHGHNRKEAFAPHLPQDVIAT